MIISRSVKRYLPTTTLPPARSLLSYNRPDSRPTFCRRGLNPINFAGCSNGDDHDSRPIMLFDGVCNLCNGVKFARDHDAKRQLRFEPLQSESGIKLLQRSGRAPDDISSVVLVERERSYTKSEVVLKIMEYLDLPFPQHSF